MKMKRALACLFILILCTAVRAQDSLTAIVDGIVPRNVDELWADYGPRAEPLDVEVIREWDEIYQGHPVKVQMLTFTVGTVRGRVSRISAYYAYPVGSQGKVPGLVQFHGGGQRANRQTVIVDAANGYACISLNWGGRELADQKSGDP
ncbi:MAG: acetylxylan esterase [Planctomycetota bacterium]|nr:acetylxylan esterase [Planctomycetota bacterium]